MLLYLTDWFAYNFPSCFTFTLISCLPVIQDLWNLSPHVIGSIGAEGAGLEGEIGPVRTSDLGHPSVSVQCPQTDMILQAHGVLHAFLQSKTHLHI